MAVLAALIAFGWWAEGVDAVTVRGIGDSEALRTTKRDEYRLDGALDGSEPSPALTRSGALPDLQATVGHLLRHRLAHYSLETSSVVSYKVKRPLLSIASLHAVFSIEEKL